MITHVRLLLLLSLLFLFSPQATDGVQAQRPVRPAASDPTWQAAYWNNTELAGPAVLHRHETTLDYNWGDGSPDPAVTADHFSARWTRFINLPAGIYRFTATSDDGVRVWVNNQLIIDQWHVHAAQSYQADLSLANGDHYVKVEYFEKTGKALIRLTWAPATSTPSAQWRGAYFTNPTLTGAPALVRDDAEIRFDWGQGSPAPGVIPADYFSVRWTRELHLPASRYRFTTVTDDGVRLFINGVLVIDQWKAMARSTFTYDIDLTEGVHSVRMEYFEERVSAFAQLSWQRVAPQATVGNIITCVPPNPPNYAWIRIYRRNGSGQWERAVPRGIGSIHPTGYLKIDGIPVNIARYGDKGEPYWIEQWIDGKVARSVGNTDRGEPEFRVRPAADNYTPWQCPQP